VVGRVEAPTRIDQHGFSARLRVEREIGAAPPAPQETVRIAWEELAPERPVRLPDGARVVVALEPLPGLSLWRHRFPQRDALAVAASGEAFLRAPDDATIAALTRWAQVAPEDRNRPPGIGALAVLAADAMAPLGGAAVARLGTIPGLAGGLDADATATLARAIGDEGRSTEVRIHLLSLAGSRRIAALRPAAATATAAGPPLAGAAWQAVAEIDGGLPPDVLRERLRDRDAGVRAVAVVWAVGTPEEERARHLAAADPVAEVRAAAVRALIEKRGRDALEIGYDALFDAAPTVKSEAAQQVARFGAEVVPHLRELALARTGQAASGPLASLALSGPEGRAALEAIAHEHSDEETRGAALLMLGRDPRREH
jgi:hypothetical protein